MTISSKAWKILKLKAFGYINAVIYPSICQVHKLKKKNGFNFVNI